MSCIFSLLINHNLPFESDEKKNGMLQNGFGNHGIIAVYVYGG